MKKPFFTLALHSGFLFIQVCRSVAITLRSRFGFE